MNWLKRLDTTKITLVLLFTTLIALAVYFANERIIYTDTAVYMDVMIQERALFIATNRFISVFAQLLPWLGIYLGLPLKTLIILYSLNAMLLPVIGAFICFHIFKSKETALGLLLFYLIMNFWLFYYPVSEFQMGLCFLFVYHAFLLHYFKNENRKLWVFVLMSLFMMITIAISHPLSIFVIVAWLAWWLLEYPYGRKWILALPLTIALASCLIRDHFFNAFVGDQAYDEQKREGLQNFLRPLKDYFKGELYPSFLKTLTDHYFVFLLMFMMLVLYFLLKKKWLQAIALPAIVFGFWLLVTVSFPGTPYGTYAEHLYQAVPFFVALAFGRYVFRILYSPVIRLLFLLGCSGIMLGKIYSNHDYFSRRLHWYRNFIGLMHDHHIQKAALNPDYILSENKYDYWASRYESLLLSSLHSPDSSAYFLVVWDAARLNKNLEHSDVFNPDYYHLNNKQPFVLLDTIASPETMRKLQWESGK
jgi:hypothetical protein